MYDGGFFPVGTTNNGQFLTFRRTHLESTISSATFYSLNEIRAYQVPNLLQELSTVTITSDTSPSTTPDLSALNLITNMSNRASNDFKPIQYVDTGLATTYKSCYEVAETDISSTGHIFIFGVDLGNIYF